MARKTFISYKYSEAQILRNKILRSLGEDATYYQGETADSPNLTDTTTENIKRNLTDMMYGTSVTIVIISPNLLQSKWIDWEIEYCLKEISREGRTSQSNGIVGVIQEVNGGYDWLISKMQNEDGCTTRSIDDSKLYDIIKSNRYKRKNHGYACDKCKTYNQLEGSYISLIDEVDFLKGPDQYIENAFEKSEISNEFELVKQR